MTLILQVSDTHFGTEVSEVCNALVAFAHEQRPEVLAITGDITQRATTEQFEAAAAFVQRLAIASVVALPGNHDIPLLDLAERAFRPYARYSRAFGRNLEPVFEDDEVLMMAVKTTRRWRHANGEVSRAQIERIAQRLKRARPGQLRMIMVHQPVAVTRPEDDQNLLRGHARAVARWADAGADLVMGGHIHLPYVLPLTGPDRPMWAVQAGTAVSSRIRSGIANSVNLIRTVCETETKARRCEVERWDYSKPTQAFELIERRVLDLRPTPLPNKEPARP